MVTKCCALNVNQILWREALKFLGTLEILAQLGGIVSPRLKWLFKNGHPKTAPLL